MQTHFSCTIKTAQNTNFNFYDYQNIGFQTKVMDNKDLMEQNLQGFYMKYLLTSAFFLRFFAVQILHIWLI